MINVPEHLKDNIVILGENNYKVVLTEKCQFKPPDPKYYREYQEKMWKIVLEIDEYEASLKSNKS